jgi:hypothetical protein
VVLVVVGAEVEAAMVVVLDVVDGSAVVVVAGTSEVPAAGAVEVVAAGATIPPPAQPVRAAAIRNNPMAILIGTSV